MKNKNKKSKRVGRGVGSGLGKTSGRGHKGSGQRKGKKTPYAGLRGGSLPYFRLIPKRGFNSPRETEFQLVNLGELKERVKEPCEINPKFLKEINLIKDENKPVKILAKIKGDFSFKATFKVDKFSAHAKELIESAGGKIETLERKKTPAVNQK